MIHSNEELSNITIKEPFKKDGLLTQVKGDVLPNKFHTYKGLRGFILAPRVIFILPLDLSPQSLESTVLPGGVHPNPRQNAVLEVPGFRVSDEQGGDSYYRMHCYAK